jgi:hypothetical protein
MKRKKYVKEVKEEKAEEYSDVDLCPHKIPRIVTDNNNNNNNNKQKREKKCIYHYLGAKA